MTDSSPRRTSDISSRTLEIAHVLFTDIVGYSKLPMDEQEHLLMQLQDSVRETSEFARAEASDELIRLPTGDGMALVFFRDAEAPVRCALELSRALRNHPDLKLRMGIHSGPVYRVADINANRNVAGGGINIAQRVMDCGDAGHILVSREVADVLGQLSGWRPMLHDIGEVEVKHGLRIHLHNLYSDEAGNTEPPKKVAPPKSVHADPVLNPARKFTRFRWDVATGVTILVIAFVVGGWLLFSRIHKAQALSATDTIVVGDFTNKTDDPIFDNTFRQGLVVQLAQSPFLGLISGERIQQGLRSMGKPADSPLASELTRELCLNLRSKAYLDGSIEGSDGDYLLSLRAVNCRSGGKLAEERAHVAEKENVLKAISQLGRKVREDLGEPTDSIRQFYVSLDTHTPSLEAFHAYASGWNALDGRGQYPELRKEIIEDRERRDIGYAEAAVPFFQQAIHWDSNFALGYSSLATSYLSMRRETLASENATKAYQLRDRVDERQRFAIESTYYGFQEWQGTDFREWQGNPNVEKARELYATWARTYPRDGEPHRAWGELYFEIGQYEKALQEFREATRLEAEDTESYLYAIQISFYLNRFADVGNDLDKLRARDSNPFLVHFFSYQLAFVKSDVAGMSREIAWAADKPFAFLFFNVDADTAAYCGKFAKARELAQRAKQSAKQNDSSQGAWGAVAEMALREVLVGNIEEGRRAGAAFDDYQPSSQETLALALAFAGETIKPRTFAEQTEKKEFRATQDLSLSAIQAQVWLNDNNPVKAVKLLEPLESYRLIERGAEYAIYVRAYANLAVPHTDAARADFQEILDHRGAVRNSLVGALAHVGLARTCVVQGDTATAKTAYQDFFKLWKDADPDIPILIAAKSEYAKLK